MAAGGCCTGRAPACPRLLSSSRCCCCCCWQQAKHCRRLLINGRQQHACCCLQWVGSSLHQRCTLARQRLSATILAACIISSLGLPHPLCCCCSLRCLHVSCCL